MYYTKFLQLSPRGRVFLVSSPSKRSCFDIVATDMEERYFS